MFSLFPKKKYLDCHLLKHSLHFFYNEIRSCCANVPGLVFYPDYKGEKVDWNYIYNYRKQIVKKINSPFNLNSIPPQCKGCFETEFSLSDKPVEKFDNIIDRLYFQTNMSCNAACTYCSFHSQERGFKYKVVPIIKSLIDEKLLSSHALAYMSGGEITISPEFEELLSLLLSYLSSKISILTNCIKYSKSIEDAIYMNRIDMLISLDSGSREIYNKVKRVDCFDNVIDNLKNYTKTAESAKDSITLKYILVDDLNDNADEIKKFLDICYDLGIKNVRLDVDFVKYILSNNLKVPDKYFDLMGFFNSRANELGLNIIEDNQTKAILNKGR